MNFEEWYHKFIQRVDIDIINPRCSAESSWDACKEEVLKLLDTYTATDEYIDTSVIKEIAKL